MAHKGGEYDVPLFNRSDESAFVKSGSRPVIFQDSFIVAVNPQPEVIVPPATGSEPTVNQAAAMSGEQPGPPQRRDQPRRATAQPDRATPRPARGAPPENVPPQPAEEQPIEEGGTDEPANTDEKTGEEDPEAAEQPESPPAVPPPPAAPQSSQADKCR